MLQKILKILTHKTWSWVFMFVIILAIPLFKTILNDDPVEGQRISSVFGTQKLKSSEDFEMQENVSVYDKFMQNKKKGGNRTYGFDPRVKIIEGGGTPLRMMYREKAKETVEPVETTKPNTSEVQNNPPVKPYKEKKIQKKEDEQRWSRSATNPEKQFENHLFKAIFREQQTIYDGKPIKIVLLEPIPELSLEPGTTLKGPASILNNARIQIRITAAEGRRQKIELECYDSDDLLEGIYSDELARQLEEYAQESLVDEILDLEFKGRGIAQKVHNLARIAKKIEIEEGREIFVKIPVKEVNEEQY